MVELIEECSSKYEIVSAPFHTDITDEIKQGLVAIGDPAVRAKAVKYILELIPDFHFRWAAHPTAVIGKNVKIGRGTMIMAGATINNGAVIGEHCLINTGVIVEHDNKIGNFVNLNPGVITGGYCEIGDFTEIGLGTMIRNKVKIGNSCLIGMGAVVISDIQDNLKAWGNPAKVQ